MNISNKNKVSKKNKIIDKDSHEKMIKVKNGFSYEKNGWKYINIIGEPKERGFAYGYLSAKEFKEIQEMLNWYMFESYGYDWDYFIKQINDSIYNLTKNDFYELFLEMEGIAEGCKANGTKTTIEEIIAWNFYMSIPYWFQIISGTAIGKEGGGIIKTMDHCSSFIAVGNFTEKGDIVVAHNSFTDYVDGQFSNVILDLIPKQGHRFIMQTSPCWIWSGTDFFVTSAGIIGTETTIGGFLPYEPKYPIGYRIRTAMQYGNNIEDYAKMLIYNNSGDYANSWLFGDIKNNEIMRLELGLKYYSISRTKNGYFIGFNAPFDPRIRNLEVNNSGFYDIRRHQGARRVRLTELMKQYKGKINIEIAKNIISDHYDVYLKKDDNPCSRTVCSHYDLDKREYMSQADRPKPYAPHGAVDGIVCDSSLAKNMSFIARFGNSCGIPFDKDKFCKEHIQYQNFCKYLKDRPTQSWTLFSSTLNTKKYSFIDLNKKINPIISYINKHKLNILGKFDSSKNDNYVDIDPFNFEYYTLDEYISPFELIKKNKLNNSKITKKYDKKMNKKQEKITYNIKNTSKTKKNIKRFLDNEQKS
jgi:hypothetical protein